MKNKFIAAAIVALIVPFSAGAQTTLPQGQGTPGPLNDLLNLIQNVKIGTPNLDVTQQSVSQTVNQIAQGNVSSGDLSSWWQGVNNWFMANTGVSLSAIIKAVVNLIIWVWEFVIKLLQNAVQNL